MHFPSTSFLCSWLKTFFGRLCLQIVFLSLLIGFFWTAPNWWSSDDTQILKHAITNHWIDFFFSPKVWTALTVSNLTPWVSLSFKVDYLLFGFQPFPFYLHQWLSMGLALSLFYMVCRWRFSPLVGSAATLFLLFSRPMLAVGHYLMVRHYIEGLVFSLAAVLCFLNGGRYATLKYWGALFFMLASTAKEIFVPLPLLLLFLPVTEIKERIARIWPMFLVLPVYTLWRYWMLGGFGGYGANMKRDEILALPEYILTMTGLSSSWQQIVVLVLFSLWFLQGSREWKLFAFVALVISIAPLIPVAGIMDVRYVLIPALLTAILFGWAVNLALKWGVGSSRGAGIVAVCLLLSGTFFWSNVQHWQKGVRLNLERLRVEGEYLLEGGKNGEYLLQPVGPSWFYSGLEWFRLNELHLPPGPKLHHEYHLITADNKSDNRYYIFSDTCMRLKEVEDYSGTILKLYGERRERVPLFLEMSYADTTISWVFGPYDQGRYAIVSEDSSIELPPQGARRVLITENLLIRLRYASPEGWRSYSPELKLEIDSGKGRLTWRRSEDQL